MRQITYARFEAAEFRRTVHRAMVEVDTTIEQILDPAYFADVASKVEPSDEIVVHWDDMSAVARLIVRSKPDRFTVLVGLESYKSFEPLAAARAIDPDYSVEFAGEHNKWRVVRIADGKVLKDKQTSKSEAQKYLTEYLKTLKA